MAWNNNYETPKSKRGMFKGRSLDSLEKQDKTASGTKKKQLNFAIRAKTGWGKVAEEHKRVIPAEQEKKAKEKEDKYYSWVRKAQDKVKKNEETVNELSDKTLTTYRHKAAADIKKRKEGSKLASSKLKGTAKIGASKVATKKKTDPGADNGSGWSRHDLDDYAAEEVNNVGDNIMTEFTIADLVTAAAESKPDDFATAFGSMINGVLQDKVAERKLELSNEILGVENVEEPTTEEDENSDDDQVEDEVSETEEDETVDEDRTSIGLTRAQKKAKRLKREAKSKE